ncbi:YjbF family lipoprotein [Paracoccaceae bacterium]|nr:YjbF family lipoprotein [Paracoccaceae bacterium]
MGSEIYLETNWSNLEEVSHERRMEYLRLDNKTLINEYSCTLTDMNSMETINLFDADFIVKHVQETCRSLSGSFVNDYYIDTHGLVRNSRQYQREKIGYMTIARLDR